MSTEFISIIIILLVCSLLFALLDLGVAGLLAWLLHLSFRRSFLWGLLLLLLPVLLLAYGTLVERNLCRVKQVEITFPTLPASFDGYRIVHLSDIHCRSFQHRPRALQRCVDRANALQPDLIAFTGDIVTLQSDELDSLLPALGQLHAPDGIFSVVGNHDYCTYSHEADGMKHVVRLEEQMGWQVLLNSHLFLHRGGDSVAVVGVENISTSRHFPTTGKLSKALSGIHGIFTILLSHDPTHWEYEVLGTNVALTLSGHTHGAQTSLLGWSPARYMYHQYRGLYQKYWQYLYVNQGLGETIFPARIGCPPEVTLITLRRG